MSEITMVCPLEIANGFRVGGLDVRECSDGREALIIVRELRGAMKNGLILISEQWVSQWHPRDREEILEAVSPRCATVPLQWRGESDTGNDFSVLLQKIVGFRIPLSSSLFLQEQPE